MLISRGASIPVLPVENVILVTAFGKHTRKIRSQVLTEFYIGDEKFEVVFLLSPKLANEAILGCEFLKEYGIRLDFRKENLCYVREGSLRCHSFMQGATEGSVCMSTLSPSCDQPCPGQRPLSSAVITRPTFQSKPCTKPLHSQATGTESLQIMVDQASKGDICGVLTVRESQYVDELTEETRVIEPSLNGTESGHNHSEERDERGKVSRRKGADIKCQKATLQR
jgi:hypothetical protein